MSVDDASGLPSPRSGIQVVRQGEPAGTSWYVTQPYDVDLFDGVPSPGPYGTFAEAELAAEWFATIVSGASD
jgi:hypothetical protein